MADFIEVHQQGKPRLVNLDWVEDIWPTEDDFCSQGERRDDNDGEP